AGVAVVARGALLAGRVRARAARRIAGTGGVALVGGGAVDGVTAHARAGLAHVGARAGVAVVALGPLGGGRVRAHARGGVALAHVVALVGRRADHRVAAHARAALAG